MRRRGERGEALLNELALSSWVTTREVHNGEGEVVTTPGHVHGQGASISGTLGCVGGHTELTALQEVRTDQNSDARMGDTILAAGPEGSVGGSVELGGGH